MSLNNDACDGKIIYFVNIWSEFEQEQKNLFLKINHCRLIAVKMNTGLLKTCKGTGLEALERS